MANQTDPLASLVHGTNPQNLIENVVKQRIYEQVRIASSTHTTAPPPNRTAFPFPLPQMYWKEECFALTPESLLEKAVEIRCVGGTHGGQRKATKFLCLVLKLLQLQPDKEIIYEFISNEVAMNKVALRSLISTEDWETAFCTASSRRFRA